MHTSMLNLFNSDFSSYTGEIPGHCGRRCTAGCSGGSYRHLSRDRSPGQKVIWPQHLYTIWKRNMVSVAPLGLAALIIPWAQSEKTLIQSQGRPSVGSRPVLLQVPIFSPTLKLCSRHGRKCCLIQSCLQKLCPPTAEGIREGRMGALPVDSFVAEAFSILSWLLFLL